MKSQIGFSLIVPVYNVEKYIDRCLRSIKEQSYENFEVLIINDGSQESEKDIILNYLQDERFKYYEMDNLGVSESRNFGIEQATKDYIWFIDSDDFIVPDAIKNIESNLEKETDILVFNYFRQIRNKSNKKQTIRIDANTVLKTYLLASHTVWSRVYRREFIENIRFESGIYNEDTLFNVLLVAFRPRIKYIDDAYYYYVKRSGSITTRTDYDVQYSLIFDILDKIYKSPLIDDYYSEIEYLYVKFLYILYSFKFIKFNKRDLLYRIKTTMDDRFPNFSENKYLKESGIDIKLGFLVVRLNLISAIKIYNWVEKHF